MNNIPADQYQLLPPLTEGEYAALKADILARGVMVAVEKDEDGNILDGFHRVRVVEELRVEGHLVELPVNIRAGLSHEEKVEHALSLNLIRRHLTREQRQQIVLKLRGEGWTTTRIAEKLQTSDGTVRNDLNAASQNYEAGLPDRVMGKDGKYYPAQRPRTIFTDARGEEQQVVGALVEIGQKLAEVEALLPPGQFKEWLAAEFGWTLSDAHEVMQAHTPPLDEVLAREVARVGGELTPTGLRLPEDLHFEDWRHLGAMLQSIAKPFEAAWGQEAGGARRGRRATKA